MEVLNDKKLARQLRARKLNLSQLAKASGVSRQSIYQMLRGGPIYNQPFLKLLTYLQIEPEVITEQVSHENRVLQQAPIKIRKIVLELGKFCKKHHASLLLFGSQANQKASAGSDWDFAVYFQRKDQDTALRLLKAQLAEQAFPFRLDIINLNRAPNWFLESIQEDLLLLEGTLPKKLREVA